MTPFDTILNTINCKNKDTFEELTLVKTRHFNSMEDEKINVYVYSYGYRYISIKTRREDTENCSYLAEEVFSSINETTGEVEYEEDLAIEEGKFYRIVKDTKVKVTTINLDDKKGSAGIEVSAGSVFVGTKPTYEIVFRNGGPVKEDTHTVFIEHTVKGKKQPSIPAKTKSFERCIFSEIKEEEFLAAI